MRTKAVLLLFVFVAAFKPCLAQDDDIRKMVDSLPTLKANSLDCSAGLYWRIVKKGFKAVPYLVDKLADTTTTGTRFRCKKTNLNVGEIAYFALAQIVELPMYNITKMKFDTIDTTETGESCWSFYGFLFVDANKAGFQKDVKAWFEKEKSNYRKLKILRKKQNDCQRLYRIDRLYGWKG